LDVKKELDMKKFFRNAMSIFLGVSLAAAVLATLPFFGPVGVLTGGGVFLACLLGVIFGALE